MKRSGFRACCDVVRHLVKLFSSVLSQGPFGDILWASPSVCVRVKARCRVTGTGSEGVPRNRKRLGCVARIHKVFVVPEAGTLFAIETVRDECRRARQSFLAKSEDLCPVRSRECILYRPAAAGQPMKRPVVSSCITSSFQTHIPQGDQAGQQIKTGKWGRPKRPLHAARRIAMAPACVYNAGSLAHSFKHR